MKITNALMTQKEWKHLCLLYSVCFENNFLNYVYILCCIISFIEICSIEICFASLNIYLLFSYCFCFLHFTNSISCFIFKEKSRPIIHPYKSPEKIFHVVGLDGSKLSSVVQILLELMFYPK